MFTPLRTNHEPDLRAVRYFPAIALTCVRPSRTQFGAMPFRLFVSDETFEGKPIQVRGIFTPITPTSMQWEQAFSPDGGQTWETNWVMRYTRTA